MIDTDYWYNKWMEDASSTACVLRVTNRCNQKCKHCAFRSGPERVGQMSLEICEKLSAWIPKKIIPNIMGGEFTILDDYPEMLVALTKDRHRVRLVTNGFWANKNAKKFFDTVKHIQAVSPQTKISIAISNDIWHKSSGERAITLLELVDLGVNVEVENLISSTSLTTVKIAPIGRAWDNRITPDNDLLHACDQMSHIVITEDGAICRCPFGYFPWKHFSETTWHDAQEYVWGWRSEKLAEGMNCHACMGIEATQCKVAK